MADEYIYPSKHDRLVIVARVLAGFVLYFVLRVSISRYVAHASAAPICEQLIYWRFFTAFFTLVFVALAIQLIRFAVLAKRHGQLPFPGTRVFFRTKIVRGPLVVVEAVSSLAIALSILVGVGYVLSRPAVLTVFSSYNRCTGA